MKGADLSGQNKASDLKERDNDVSEGKERSRGKRRTAREIAQMFEQLKQRHSARKQEWQAEKRELLRRAELAGESKKLLGDLKQLLEDLSSQLNIEQSKQANLEGEFEEAKTEWKLEKEKLLKTVANLETKRFSGSSDKKLLEELNSVKSRLLASEKELNLVRKSNNEVHKSLEEMKRSFLLEKQRLMKEQEGEKRNWEKARQVMLDKIESLQEEIRSFRSKEFPLHGSHVASPLDEVIAGLTSPEADDYFQQKRKISSPDVISNANRTSIITSTDATNSAYFQRTVDEALTQIEKFTQELKEVSTKEPGKHSLTSKNSSSDLRLSSETASCSRGPSKEQNIQKSDLKKSKLPKQLPASMRGDQSDVSRSPRLYYSCVEQKEIKENKLEGNAKTLLDTSPKISNSSSPASFAKLAKIDSFSKTPENSLSPSSCSIPAFTESSPESVSGQTVNIKKDSFKSNSHFVTKGKGSSDLDSLRKSETSSSDKKEKMNNTFEGSVPKTLPNLHQQLLFGVAGISQKGKKLSHEKLEKRRRSINESNKEVVDESISRSLPKSHFNIEKDNTGLVKKPSSPSSDFVDDALSTSRNLDFIIKPTLKEAEKNSSLDAAGPPVRPKPSVTIEKDQKGNVLRVISDPTFKRQESPGNINEFDNMQELNLSTRNRRRRSQEVIHDLEPLTSINHLSNFETNSSINNGLLIGTDVPSVKIQEKESFGSKGKTWIKKRLPFFDTSHKTESAKAEKFQHLTKRKTRTRSSERHLSQRQNEQSNYYYSESTSDDDKTPHRQERNRPQYSKKIGDEKRSKKRYNRSKTDSSVDVRNLLSKFKSSQFKSNKPSVVKEFEKKLLENEVKTLDQEVSAQEQSYETNAEQKKLSNCFRKKSVNDDGYSGEDELEVPWIAMEKSKLGSASKHPLVRSGSIRSLQEHEYSPLSFAHQSYHRSLVDLSSLDYLQDNSDDEFSNKIFHQNHGSKNSPNNVQFVRTSFFNNPKQTSVTGNEQRIQSSSKCFDRKEPCRLTLPERTRQRPGLKKRLSWAANVKDSIEEENDPALKKKQETKERVSTSVSGILLKPQKYFKKFKESSENFPERTRTSPGQATACDKSKYRLSKQMQTKAENLEKALKRGSEAGRVRRYQRSKTQPILQSSSSEGSDSAQESSIQEKSHSALAKTSLKRLQEEFIPTLNSRFKKPAPANRRLPSRWRKK